jgi:hypothetical protein
MRAANARCEHAGRTGANARCECALRTRGERPLRARGERGDLTLVSARCLADAPNRGRVDAL